MGGARKQVKKYPAGLNILKSNSDEEEKKDEEEPDGQSEHNDGEEMNVDHPGGQHQRVRGRLGQPHNNSGAPPNWNFDPYNDREENDE